MACASDAQRPSNEQPYSGCNPRKPVEHRQSADCNEARGGGVLLQVQLLLLLIQLIQLLLLLLLLNIELKVANQEHRAKSLDHYHRQFFFENFQVFSERVLSISDVFYSPCIVVIAFKNAICSQTCDFRNLQFSANT